MKNEAKEPRTYSQCDVCDNVIKALHNQKPEVQRAVLRAAAAFYDLDVCFISNRTLEAEEKS